MTLRIAPGSADATIAMAIADKTKLREIEIFIYGLSIAREAKGGQRARHLSKLTVCGRTLDNLRWSDVRVLDHLANQFLFERHAETLQVYRRNHSQIERKKAD